MLVIAPAVPETFLPEAEDGFVRMGLPSPVEVTRLLGNIRVLFEFSGLPI
jgi:hypothetical protein